MSGDVAVNVVNVVASVTLSNSIDLEALVRAFPSVEYRPEQFPGVIFRLKRPKTATLIFGSGKMVCTGARSEGETRRAIRNVVRRLKKGGVPIKGKTLIEVQNIVASASLGGTIDLVHLCETERSMGGRIIYEPEQFPGLMYRTEDPKAVILLFSSGKLVCTGARTAEDAHRAVNELYQRLEEKNLIYYG